ncbi:type I phosphomannose isomerase catalytic subunit [Paenibacillus thalictri]|uniref:Mannose-6-phosphate isomerase n=1 Tax=Paenibacillus thalictri TaxID=2527873 RepID=A0A4Q9DZN1_9BACL|nr:type I phosphomannose isomerase catalytic subunit [Paenibacillus thalictri]TBL80741.1 mannose-6-phosphate isomerase [Paenibacillus thalictri]
MTAEPNVQIEPFKLSRNRVWRTYAGGEFLERWQGGGSPADSSFPEEWVASTVIASNAGREDIVEGLSEIALKDGSSITLKDLIAMHPAELLGPEHMAQYGQETALLVKVLDAGERLTIQVHPDREFAQSAFQSRFGKTEAWYILGGRTIDGEEPYVLFGFKPGVTREIWQALFDKQDIDGMRDALHKIPVRAGDVFLVEGGVPHAIGSGCFLIEIQEPTDYTLRVERTTPRGLVLADKACHQGLGFEKMMECFHYEALDEQETLRRWKKEPALVRHTEAGSEYALISKSHTDRFSMRLLDIHTELAVDGGGTFAIAIVVSGSGSVGWQGQEREIGQADEFFIPAALKKTVWKNSGEAPLNVILCYPPE